MTKPILGCLLSLSFFVLAGCGGSSGGGGGTSPGGSLSLTLSNSAPLVFPSQGTTSVTATIGRTGTTGNVSLSVTGLPTAATVTIQSPGSGNSGTITIGAGSAAAGNYSATVVASDGAASASSNLTLTVGATTQISNTVSGRLQFAMSTSFQTAEWDYNFFTKHPSAVTPLGNLQPQNIRLQPISKGIPQTSATAWDFSYIDAIAQPVLTVGDHSPEFQIALAPSFMYDSSHNFLDPTYGQFAAYTQDLVRYYNLGGFTDAGGTFHKSASTFPVTWWGIYNEPNYNNVTPSQYVQIYNTVVPAMRAVDPNLKFAAIELGGGTGNEQAYLPPFVSGVTAQVDVVATHYYSSCNQSDTDTKIFATVPMFASQLSYIRSQLATNPALSGVPVWVTENNVNADFQGANGNSSCNPRIFRGVAPVCVLATGEGRSGGALSLGFSVGCAVRRT